MNSANGTTLASRILRRNDREVVRRKVFHELLIDGGCTAQLAFFEVGCGGNFDLPPIESVVLVEARIFGGNNGVLKMKEI